MNGSEGSSPQSPISNEEDGTAAKRKNSKVNKPRLTAEQKNDNHKEAENKRRTAIRDMYTDLSHLVPGTVGQERSEQVMLTKTADYLKTSIEEIRQLELQAAQMGIATHDVGKLTPCDYGGSNWQQPNLERYHILRAKKAVKRGVDLDAEAEDDE